jgi:hypothetical protein
MSAIPLGDETIEAIDFVAKYLDKMEALGFLYKLDKNHCKRACRTFKSLLNIIKQNTPSARIDKLEASPRYGDISARIVAQRIVITNTGTLASIIDKYGIEIRHHIRHGLSIITDDFGPQYATVLKNTGQYDLKLQRTFDIVIDYLDGTNLYSPVPGQPYPEEGEVEKYYEGVGTLKFPGGFRLHLWEEQKTTELLAEKGLKMACPIKNGGLI